jgi:hypothetical protein
VTLTLGLVTGFVEGATPVAYLGEANELAILLGNTGERPLTLSATGTTITATFGGLFAAADLTLASGDGAWTGAWAGETLTLTATAEVVVGTNAVVKVPVGSVTVGGEARSETLTLECDYTLPALGPDSVSALPTLAVHAQPSTDPTRQLNLNVQFLPGSDVVYRTDNALLDAELPNIVSFSISNPAATPLLAADVAWTTGAAPEFRLWFAYAPDEQHPNWGALTTLERAATMSVSAADASWTVDASNANAGYWLLEPVNQAILGAGADASEVFTIGNLVTMLQPGTTLLYLQYRNIPGYDDGLITLPLEKREPAPGILGFWVDQPLAETGNAVTFTWAAFAVDYVVLEWRDPTGTSVRKELRGVTSWPPKDSPADAITPTMDTTYTLCAYSRAGSQLGGDLQQTVTLVDAPSVTSLWAADFMDDVQNYAITSATDGTVVALNWTTANTDAVTLTLGGAEAGQPVVGFGPDQPAASAPNGKTIVTVKRGANCFRITPSRGGVPGPPLDVTIVLVPIVSLSCNPAYLPADYAAHDLTLTWVVDDPDADLVITPQVGDVKGLTQKTVQATVGDSFTLTATNPTTHAQGTFVLYVWGPPPPADPSDPYGIHLNFNIPSMGGGAGGFG